MQFKTTVNPEFNEAMDKSKFQGVPTISLEFLDGTLMSLGIAYNSSFQYQTLNAFIAAISKSLNLPNTWQTKSWRGTELECGDLHATARLIAGSPSITIEDTASRKNLDERIARGVEAPAQLPEVPVLKETTNRSVVKLLKENQPVPDFVAGYAAWHEAFESGNAGIYPITIAEAVAIAEQSLKQ